MPEFILDTSGFVAVSCGDDSPSAIRTRWNALDAFTQGYLEALFFTENDPSICCEEWQPGHEFIDGSVPSDAGYSDLHPASLQRAINDCARLQEENRQPLQAAMDLQPGSDEFRYARENLDDRRLGQLFWYARNGHGVGFTDDGGAACLETLQDISRGYGEISVSYGEAIDDESRAYVFAE